MTGCRIPETALERALYRIVRAIARTPLGWLALMAGVHLAGVMVALVGGLLLRIDTPGKGQARRAGEHFPPSGAGGVGSVSPK